MTHIWINGTEVESFSTGNPYLDFDRAYEEAQQWANRYGLPAEIWEYEGHESFDDGQCLAIVSPQPLQLALVAGMEAIAEATP